MATVGMSEARDHFAAVIRRAEQEPVTIERRGTGRVVMVSVERYERMAEALDEIEDIAAFDAAMAEDGDNLPWDEVKRELGW